MFKLFLGLMRQANIHKRENANNAAIIQHLSRSDFIHKSKEFFTADSCINTNFLE